MLGYNATIKKAIRKNIKEKNSWFLVILTALPFIIIGITNFIILKDFISSVNILLNEFVSNLEMSTNEFLKSFLVIYSENQTKIIITVVISVLSLIINIITNIFIYHYSYYKIKGEKYNAKETLKNLWSYFCVELLKNIKIFLYSLLFIIPGIIKSFAYSLSLYIKIENPDLKASQCIKKSIEKMDGKKERLFIQVLSFIIYSIIISLIAGFAIGIIDVIISKFSVEVATIINNSLNIIVTQIETILLVSVIAIFYDEIKRDEEYLDANPELKEKGINIVLRDDDEVKRNIYIYNPYNPNYYGNNKMNNKSQEKNIDPFEDEVNIEKKREENNTNNPFEE